MPPIDPPPVPPLPPDADHGPGLHGCRVLLVEDSPPDQFVYKTVLLRAGAAVSAVTDGGLALAAAAAGRPFDVAVVDLVLPDMRGTELVTRLRAAGFRGGAVGVSAYLTAELIDLWRAAGCDEVLAKDDGFDRIVRAVADACAKRAAA